MKRTDLLTMDELLGDVSPERQATWDRLALARAVANALVTYRGQHRLSQRALAAELGVRPSVVARLELAEHNPSIDTLRHLAGTLGLRIALEVVPPGHDPMYLPGEAGPRESDVPARDTRVLTAVA